MNMTTDKPDSHFGVERGRLKAKIEQGCMKRFDKDCLQEIYISLVYELTSPAEVKNIRSPIITLLDALDHDSITESTFLYVN